MKTILISTLILFLLSGCTAKNILTPSAKNVRIYNKIPTNLNCEYKDEIIGSEGNMFRFLFVSNRDMTAGALADLRNQASRLGGNAIEIRPTDFMYTTSTVFIGDVYTCHSK